MTREEAIDLLQLGSDPTSEEVKIARTRLLKRYHPDRHPGANDVQNELLREKFQAVSDAAALLLNGSTAPSEAHSPTDLKHAIEIVGRTVGRYRGLAISRVDALEILELTGQPDPLEVDDALQRRLLLAEELANQGGSERTLELLSQYAEILLAAAAVLDGEPGPDGQHAGGGQWVDVAFDAQTASFYRAGEPPASSPRTSGLGCIAGLVVAISAFAGCWFAVSEILGGGFHSSVDGYQRAAVHSRQTATVAAGIVALFAGGAAYALTAAIVGHWTPENRSSSSLVLDILFVLALTGVFIAIGLLILSR